MEVWPLPLVVILTLCVVSPCCGLEAMAKNVTVAQLLPMSSYHGGLATYNAKNFGAEGNGTNDDTKVRIQFLNRLLGWCSNLFLSLLSRSNYVVIDRYLGVGVQALMAAWKAACGASGTVTLLIPPGTYYIGPTKFHGPCKASAITFLLQASSCAVIILQCKHDTTGKKGSHFICLCRGRSRRRRI